MKNKQKILLGIAALLSIGLCACGENLADDSIFNVNIKKTDTTWDSQEKQYTITANHQGKTNIPLKIKNSGIVTITTYKDGVYDPGTTFKSEKLKVKKGECVEIPVSVINNDSNGGAVFYIKAKDTPTQTVFVGNPNMKDNTDNSNNNSSMSESNDSSSNNSDNSTNNQIKDSLNSIDKDQYHIKSFKITGFDEDDIAGGAIVVKTSYPRESLESDDVDNIIYATCNAIKNDNIGTGINIKIVAPTGTNGHSTVGSCHVSPSQIKKVTKDDVDENVSDYSNNLSDD